MGSCDGKVGQRSRPSAGELLKRPGEMMSSALFLPPPPHPVMTFFFFPLLPEARQQEQNPALVEAVTHIKHATVMTSPS